jgi:hypothetical protein
MLHATSNRHHTIRGHRSESELILACCQNPWQSIVDDAVLQIIDSGVDWGLLLELADFHAVTLLVGSRLSAIGTSGLPQSVLEQVRYSQYEATKRNLRQTAELLFILKLLHQNGVQVIPFKGPVLARYLYGDRCLRESWDIDLIVQQQDVLSIKRILASAGFVPWLNLAAAQEIPYIRSACVYELRNPDKNLHVELHWKNSKHPSLPFPDYFVWARQQETSFAGTQIKTLSPETLLLLLCAHGTKHCWRRLRYLCDTADLIRVTEHIDWSGLLKTADQLGARRMVLTGLSLAHGLLQAPVPEEILQATRKNPQVQRIAAECSAKVLHGSRQEPGYWDTGWFNLRSFDRWQGRLRYLTHMLFSPGIEDFKATRLPRFLFPLYRGIRLLRLFGQLTLRASSTTASR